ncbi:deoxyribodipyrimidine photo-lyase [Alloiococcus sp. CFN-8]|uniref:deoxyribodipyrimidine photo-lyase n=1 Tax=Alloiococcus sp. CFN-8 TaxID=3416081 RepID=UPI003CEF8B88
MIQDERIKSLNNKELNQEGLYVLYWMESSQRAEYNHALEYALDRANSLGLPLIVYIGIHKNSLHEEAQERHFVFMLQGLKELEKALQKRGLKLLAVDISPEKGAIILSKEAALVVVDRGYSTKQRQWREESSSEMACPLIQIETDVIVPVEEASFKEEYSAATFRRRVTKRLYEFILPLKERSTLYPSMDIKLPIDSLSLENISEVLNKLSISNKAKASIYYTGGTKRAKKLLKEFIAKSLDSYEERGNDPSENFTSLMGAYLRFGQISPLYIYFALDKVSSPGKLRFLDELIIRRELAFNFVYYNENYDSYKSIPLWARDTLESHKEDYRPYIYSKEDIEKGSTHDIYFNASERELIFTGRTQGYMRMYWCKKIIEWSLSPEEAFYFALYLNNTYSLDGGAPASYAGIAWCFGKHDRAWKGREVFGTVRYMSFQGLKRKFLMDSYVKKVDSMVETVETRGKIKKK